MSVCHQLIPVLLPYNVLALRKSYRSKSSAEAQQNPRKHECLRYDKSMAITPKNVSFTACSVILQADCYTPWVLGGYRLFCKLCMYSTLGIGSGKE